MVKILLAFAVLIIIVLALAFYQKQTSPIAKIKNQEFKLLLTKTEKDRQIGLSKHDKLPTDKAMLFIFAKKDYYRFWMKDMKFPIDIIFIKDNKIAKIYENASVLKAPVNELPIYSPPEPINKVLEINAGISKKYNFKAGDTIEFRNIK